MNLPADRGAIAGFVVAVLAATGALAFVLLEDPFVGHEDDATRYLYEIGTVAFAAGVGAMVGSGVYGAMRRDREFRLMHLLLAAAGLGLGVLVVAVGYDGA